MPNPTTESAANAVELAGENLREIELDISGMTCAACANRIEKKLNRLEGVTASVNFATERATATVADGVAEDDLIRQVERTGYGASVRRASTPNVDNDGTADEVDNDLELSAHRRKLIAVAALTIPVIAISMIPALQFPYWRLACLLLTTPVIAWGGWQFHRRAATGFVRGDLNMDTLVSLGTLSAFVYSVWSLIADPALIAAAGHPGGMAMDAEGSGHIYFEAAAGVTLFVLAGRYLEVRSKRQTSAAIQALFDIRPVEVTVRRSGNDARIPIADLRVGDVFLARPGERIAADGRIRSGSGAVDTSMLTGESVPQEVGPGDGVIAGCVNITGALEIEAERVGDDTRLAEMARMVERAQAGKARVQRLVDRVSAIFVPTVLVLAALAFTGWMIGTGDANIALNATLSVLLIACPCALGLATPMALLVASGRGAELGVLISGPEALEQAKRIDTVVLDKTGTLTEGIMRVVDVHTAGSNTRQDVLRLAAALEAQSEHPIAHAIVEAANVPHSESVEEHARDAVADFESLPGGGVRGRVNGRDVAAGNRRLMERIGAAFDPALDNAAASAAAQGHTIVLLAIDGVVSAVISIADEIKPTAARAIADLRDLGLNPVLLTGDHERAAERVAAQLGITEVIAGVSPEQKTGEVQRLQGAGSHVAMVGDGVNDSPALAQADLGIAIGTGTDAAMAASDITLVSGDPRGIPIAITLAKRTLGTIRTNIFWAFIYNVAAIPLAMLGRLNPMVAGLAMALSSVFVVLNSQRLRTVARGTEQQ